MPGDIPSSGENSESEHSGAEDYDLLRNQTERRNLEMKEKGKKVALEKEHTKIVEDIASMNNDVFYMHQCYIIAQNNIRTFIAYFDKNGYSERNQNIGAFNSEVADFNKEVDVHNRKVDHIETWIRNFNVKVKKHNDSLINEENRVEEMTNPYQPFSKIEKSVYQLWQDSKSSSST